MGFISVARAVYDYNAQVSSSLPIASSASTDINVLQGSDELTIVEGDLLLVQDLDHGDGWTKAKRKAGDDEEDEPEGLAPANYIEDVSSLSLRHTHHT